MRNIQSQKKHDSHRNVKYNKGNIVKNTIITMYGAWGTLDIGGDHFVKYMTVQPLKTNVK